VLSVLAILVLWVAFTNSTLPFPQAKGPYDGQFSFTYTSTLEDGRSDDAEVVVLVHREDLQLTRDEDGNPLRLPPKPEVEEGDGFAKNDSLIIPRYGSKIVPVFSNDEFKRGDGALVTQLNGQAVEPGDRLDLEQGTLSLTRKGGVFFEPATGFRMARLYLPAPEITTNRFLELNADGYRNFTLLDGSAVDHGDCRTGWGVWSGYCQSACGLLAGCEQVANPAQGHHPELTTGDFYRSACGDGRMLGHRGCGRACGRREGSWHDDHGRLQVSAY